MSNRPRYRDLGLTIGELPPGRFNAITDVAGVRVGHVTLIEGDGALVPGVGPVRTGGIGTSSRVLPPEAGGYALGVLVMSNFGWRENLVVDGVPVGRELRDWNPPPPGDDPEKQGSSIIIVVATDAPLNSRQLERLSVRAGGGLARAGGLYSTSSGDFVIAFSTSNITPHHPGSRQLNQGVLAE